MSFSNGSGTGTLHVAQALTDLAVAYRPSADGYLRDKFFPRKDVAHLTDKLRQIDKANTLLLHDLKVGNDGRVPETQYRITTDITYNCQAYGTETVVGDMDLNNADEALEHETRQMQHGLDVLTTALEHEAVKNTLRSTSVLTNNQTQSAAQRWDNYTSASSDPIGDMLSARTLVSARIGGKAPNALGMSEWTWNKIMNHPNVLERVKFQTGSAGSILTPKILADILRIQESAILISASTYNSAAQGATASYKSFIGSDVVMAYVEDGGRYDYSLGHEFAFSGYGSQPVVVVKYRDEKRGGLLGSNVVRVGSIVDFKVTQPEAAFLYKACLDTSASEYGGFID
jgi:hypothetical protein